MKRAHYPPRLACLAVVAGLLWPVAVLADHDRIADPPPTQTDAQLPEGLGRGDVTVSGLSSGGFFAHQFHVAFSATVSGAGIIAGGPYACVETITNPYWPLAYLDQVSAAVVACTHYWGDSYWGLEPSPPDAADSVELIEEAWSDGAVDDPANLADDRVWLFRGDDDDVVPAAVAEALAAVYRDLGVDGPDLEVHRHAADHGMPVRQFPDDSRFPPRSCADHAPPYIIECGFDAARLLLRHLYPGFSDEPADAHEAGTLAAFDQTAFFAGGDAASLSPVGYVYVPDACRAGRASPCRLHVALHGCRQAVERIHDDFVRDAGYNGWAAANDIVVLFPQVTTDSAANPNGCWDFWGYSGDDYRVRDGKQMQAVKAMVDHLLGAAE